MIYNLCASRHMHSSQQIHNVLNLQQSALCKRLVLKYNHKHTPAEHLHSFTYCCHVACLMFKLSRDKATGWLRKAMHLWSYAQLVLHFTSCSGDIIQLWWHLFMSSFFSILCIELYWNQLTIDVIPEIKMWTFNLGHSVYTVYKAFCISAAYSWWIPLFSLT